MSTFLQLARKLREDCGISGAENTPTTVTGQQGEMRRVVNWVKRAYREVQNLHINWGFLRRDFSFLTTATVQTYTRAATTLTAVITWKLDSFRCYLTASGVTDEQYLSWTPWDAFRDTYLLSANRSVTGRPTHFTVKPDKSIALWPTPDAVYTIAGEAWDAPHSFTADADESVIPEAYDDAVLGKAMEYYGAFEAAPEVFAEGQARYSTGATALERDYLPPIEGAGALA